MTTILPVMVTFSVEVGAKIPTQPTNKIINNKINRIPEIDLILSFTLINSFLLFIVFSFLQRKYHLLA